jgi:hypothetical protein
VSSVVQFRRLSNVVKFRRRDPSEQTSAKLVELGYLKPGKRHNAQAVENAVARLRHDLHRKGEISDSEISSKEEAPQIFPPQAN